MTVTVGQLTPDDTFDIYKDSRCFGGSWVDYGNETIDRAGSIWAHIRKWSAEASDKSSRLDTRLDHERVLNALVRIAEGETRANEVTTALVRNLLDADNNDRAMTELGNLNTGDHDEIIQVAVVGDVHYR